MSKTIQVRLLTVALVLAAVTTAYHQSTEQMMVDAANHFLSSLTNEQRGQTMFAFSQKDRETWHFVPDNNFEDVNKYKRRGLIYGKMQPEQRHLADVLLSTGLSKAGFIKAKSVMSLEEVLRIMEGDLTGRRDPYVYHFSVFGTPSEDGAWGWRVEGHHISLHFTLKGGKLISTSPTFFGSNPHRVPSGPRTGLRPLGREEDVARELMKALDMAQRNEALVAEKAYRDILTSFSTRAKLDNQPPGIQASKLNEAQFAMLIELLSEYANNLPAEQAAKRMAAVKATPRDKMLFAWAGGIEQGRGDYYRVQAPTFLVEYDNTQNKNNHSHTVWRDFENDFARDVLAAHHEAFDHAVAAD